MKSIMKEMFQKEKALGMVREKNNKRRRGGRRGGILEEGVVGIEEIDQWIGSQESSMR